MPLHPRFRKKKFPNGLTLLSEQWPGFQSLSLGIWVKVGTRHEHSKIHGASHFLEHMLFKGTKKRTALQIARAVDQVGGEFNAFTAREHTCFHLLMLKRDYPLGLDILSDVLLNTHFHETDLERERSVILQEIAMIEESPEELVHDLFFESVYKGHGLGRSILGTTKSIQRMSRSDLLEFFQSHYRPEEVILAVAGDLSHEAIEKQIRPLIGKSWPGRKTSQKRVDIPAAPLAPGLKWVIRPTEQVHLIWGVTGLPYASPDRFAAFLLNVYLGGGMSSALFQEIREKNGLAYTVYSHLSPFMDSGVFSIYAATQMSKVPLCLTLIEKCVQQLKTRALSKRELRMLQDNLKSTLLLSADSVESRMSSIAKNEIFLGQYFSTEEVCRQIDAVTPQDLKRIATTLFHSDQRSILALGPKPPASLIKTLKPQWVDT